MRAQFDRLVFVSRFRFTSDQGVQTSVEDASAKDLSTARKQREQPAPGSTP
jgi:hypothetical protein